MSTGTVVMRSVLSPTRIPTPGFTVHDVHGYYRVNETISLVVGGKNITDKFYREHLDPIQDTSGPATIRGIPRRGRSIYAAIQATY